MIKDTSSPFVTIAHCLGVSHLLALFIPKLLKPLVVAIPFSSVVAFSNTLLKSSLISTSAPATGIPVFKSVTNIVFESPENFPVTPIDVICICEAVE